MGAFAGALVAATGALCRLGHLPAPVIVPVQLLVLLEWVTLTYARSEAFLGVVPTGASIAALADLVRQRAGDLEGQRAARPRRHRDASPASRPSSPWSCWPSTWSP